MTIRSVVIVGGGQAGFQTALSLRQEGFAGEVVLIGDVPSLPYQRPPLSKAYLLGKIGVDALRFRPEKFFTDHRIELRHDVVAAIDRTNRCVTLGSGTSVPYDHLVLAVGAHNRTLPGPGVELDGVLGLRTLADADALRARLKEAKNVVVVGAGFIGLEFAAVANALGANVNVLELADRAMARAVTPEMSYLFADAHRSWGVHLEFRQGLSGIEGSKGKVAGVKTTDGGRLPADLLVFGVGVLPNVQLAAEAGLDVENGIRTDAHLVTSDPAISAIGDCAQFPSLEAGGTVRLESVQNATDQARTVAARLARKPAHPYAAFPWFWTDQGDLKLQMVGLVGGCDETVVLGSAKSRSLSVLCFRHKHLIAVESVNRPADHMAARRLFTRTPTLSPHEAAAPGFDLKTYEALFR
jgi:NADPH-dependent 2,4-dienoyl-CoA reductase/sulfur reductase-like enzyme